jgi:murein DD-endopeptidase MepM/ murein hydrolase activator NlpD
MLNKCIILLNILIAFTVQAQEIKFFGEAKPAAVVIGSGKEINKVWLDGKALQIDKQGIFVFGFDHDAKGAHKLKVQFKNKKVKTYKYDLEEREYSKQKLHIAKKFVNPPKRELKIINSETKLMSAARAKVGKDIHAYFMSGFRYPVDSVQIREVFGDRRILNGQPKNIHNGVDFAASQGDSIRAIADGIVRIAGSNFFYNGTFIMLDHGQGLTSVYLHMSKLIAADGQKVKKGQVIGLAGATGRATGPHLHLGVQWYKKRIDPLNLLSIKFGEEEQKR